MFVMLLTHHWFGWSTENRQSRLFSSFEFSLECGNLGLKICFLLPTFLGLLEFHDPIIKTLG